MPIVTIDAKQVEVPEGATILDAAEKLGIEIPTLCFLKGYEPSTSCLVCVVRDRQTGRIVPSCATRVVDGMEIDNDTDEVRDLRRTALELLLSEHVGDCLAPCYFACPAHMDIPLMLRQISDRDIPDAIATIKHDIALPAVLGRVCSKPCEKGCRRNGADHPVAVCELKRYVADMDLARDDPYMPRCRARTGKRIAVIGAGASGLAAVYYLRRSGHECVLFDRESVAGGRLREESPETLPPEVLDAEIQQILRLGVDTRWGTPIATAKQVDELCDQYDAVLFACGPITPDQVELLGLKAARRGIQVGGDTYQTSRPGVFAVGNAVRGKAIVVRCVADGKEAAHTIDQYVSGRTVRGAGRPFSSRINKMADDEMDRFLENARASCDEQVEPGHEFSSGEAADVSDRCLSCGCSAHNDCKLERYAIMYQANSTHYGGVRRPYELIGRNSAVVFEPGKCIKCELCVKIAAANQEPLGLAFVGRGFDLQVTVPFGGEMDDALRKVAADCVQACPTGALRFSPSKLVQLDLTLSRERAPETEQVADLR